MDLLIIIITSALLIPLAIFTSGLVRIVIGLLFVLFFPGYNHTTGVERGYEHSTGSASSPFIELYAMGSAALSNHRCLVSFHRHHGGYRLAAP